MRNCQKLQADRETLLSGHKDFKGFIIDKLQQNQWKMSVCMRCSLYYYNLWHFSKTLFFSQNFSILNYFDIKSAFIFSKDVWNHHKSESLCSLEAPQFVPPDQSLQLCVCVLHLLIGKFMPTGGTGFLIKVLLWVHHFFWSVLMLVNAGVFGPHAAPHRPAQLWQKHTHLTSHSVVCAENDFL